MRRITVTFVVVSAMIGCASTPEMVERRVAPEKPSAEEADSEIGQPAEELEKPDTDALAPEYSVTSVRSSEGAPERATDSAIVLPSPEWPETQPETTRRRSLDQRYPVPSADAHARLPLPEKPVAIAVLDALTEENGEAAREDDDVPAWPPADRAEALPQPDASPDRQQRTARDLSSIEADRKFEAPSAPPDSERIAEPEPERPRPRADDSRQDPDGVPLQRDKETAAPERTPRAAAVPDAEDRTASLLPAQRHPVGEEFSVELPGTGWVYLGIGDGHDRVEFRRRSERENHSEFVFRVREPGEFRLRFQRQDAIRGEIQEHELRVTASEALEDTGDATELAEIADAEDSAPDVFDAEPEEPGEREPDGLALSKHDGLDAPRISEEELLARAGAAVEDDAVGEAIRLYEQYLSARNPGENRAEAHFTLGRLYERNSVYRNLRKSREHYTTVINDFPMSEHYSASQQRVRYLNRHFFEVR